MFGGLTYPFAISEPNTRFTLTAPSIWSLILRIEGGPEEANPTLFKETLNNVLAHKSFLLGAMRTALDRSHYLWPNMLVDGKNAVYAGMVCSIG